ncbi:uncharacterized protein LOC129588819 [Paramacrobiotus metropolitanus]|uniref:uncharacterized protein LOC129588819 n=1 Tax=Paramacrobiotus metropolitanus TaxID=2943436 RepID=UPI0024461253|nr:uncharacterized protein LOC129588819 [Paramacrobiotus metropolitanus]
MKFPVFELWYNRQLWPPVSCFFRVMNKFVFSFTSVFVCLAAPRAGIAQPHTSAQPPTVCLQCYSQVTESCGKRFDDEKVQQALCDAGYCYTYVSVEIGSVPQVWRGCGGVSCSLIPNPGAPSEYCDEAGRLVIVNTSNGELFNQSRSFGFYGPFGPKQTRVSGTVRNCDVGSNCNSESAHSLVLQNYQHLAVSDSQVSDVAVSGGTPSNHDLPRTPAIEDVIVITTNSRRETERIFRCKYYLSSHTS